MPNKGSLDWCRAVEDALGGQEALTSRFGKLGMIGKTFEIPDADLPGTGGTGSTFENVGVEPLITVPAFSVFLAGFFLETLLPADPANGAIALNATYQVVALPTSGAWTTLVGVSGATPIQIASFQPTAVAPLAWTPCVGSPNFNYFGQDVDLYFQATLFDAAHEAVAGTKIRNTRIDILV